MFCKINLVRVNAQLQFYVIALIYFKSQEIPRFCTWPFLQLPLNRITSIKIYTNLQNARKRGNVWPQKNQSCLFTVLQGTGNGVKEKNFSASQHHRRLFINYLSSFQILFFVTFRISFLHNQISFRSFGYAKKMMENVKLFQRFINS